MLQIGYLIICEDTFEENDRPIIKRPLAALTPIGIPSNYSFKVAFSLHDTEPGDFSKENKIRITFNDPNDTNIVDTGELIIAGDDKKEMHKVRISEAEVSFNNIDIRHEGIHTLSLMVNDDFKEIKVPVRKKQF